MVYRSEFSREIIRGLWFVVLDVMREVDVQINNRIFYKKLVIYIIIFIYNLLEWDKFQGLNCFYFLNRNVGSLRFDKYRKFV